MNGGTGGGDFSLGRKFNIIKKRCCWMDFYYFPRYDETVMYFGIHFIAYFIYNILCCGFTLICLCYF